jgi:hypothetical protein
MAQGGQRRFTVLVYLNDVASESGVLQFFLS